MTLSGFSAFLGGILAGFGVTLFVHGFFVRNDAQQYGAGLLAMGLAAIAWAILSLK